ncbi:cysteine desulfurase [Carnobacterium iners]|uniref:Cysteine desulfurase n=1 Tax=Carnobacterium iners TaxID=1073423 RepID=A0A1X7NNT0_9LACT|nr:cysteine desulfurase family protein [Carnobacterium iners]SEK31594.1 cysteine desulfurase [Carnobacterium iners]SMH39222.1 cysteine desulfurase [Carnobacterium iners]
MIYFDNSATTSVNEEVLQTIIEVTKNINGNPSSMHEIGNKSAALIHQSRTQIASLLAVSPEEIFFTSGGTEGDNWAVKGTAIEKKNYGNHIITTTIEHPAVSESIYQLEQFGFEVTYLSVDKDGIISVKDLEKAIRKDTILVSVMAVNNEVGSLQPIEEIGEVLKNYPTIHFHVDAVQAIGKIPLLLGPQSRIDIAVFSSHKFHGPKGAGFIYLKKGRKIAPLFNGGGQENRMRSGTENVAGIAATGKALRLILTDSVNKQEKQRKIRDYLMNELASYKKVMLFSTKAGAPHILCFALKGIRGEVLLHAFENELIYISTTSACSSKNKKSSGTLSAMHIPNTLAVDAVRVSLSDTNTLEEAKQFLSVFKVLYKKFQSIHA